MVMNGGCFGGASAFVGGGALLTALTLLTRFFCLPQGGGGGSIRTLEGWGRTLLTRWVAGDEKGAER